MPIHKVVGQPKTETVAEAPVHVARAENQAKKSSKGLVILLIIAVITSIGFGWSLMKYLETKKQLAVTISAEAQQEAIKKEVAVLLAKVGKLIVLPTNEEPTVATITDAASLKKEQQFYADAVDGNKVLVYMQAKKAIIYDEQKNLIINVGPIFVSDSATTTPTIPDASGE
jgi:hypothetical protein